MNPEQRSGAVCAGREEDRQQEERSRPLSRWAAGPLSDTRSSASHDARGSLSWMMMARAAWSADLRRSK